MQIQFISQKFVHYCMNKQFEGILRPILNRFIVCDQYNEINYKNFQLIGHKLHQL